MKLEDALDYFSVKTLDGYDVSQLRSDYKKLAKIYHPDMNNGNHQAFVKLRQAYHLISENLNLVDNKKQGKTFRTMHRDQSATVKPGFNPINNNVENKVSFNDTNSLQIQLQILYGETQNTSIETKEKFQQLWDDFSIRRSELIKVMETELEKLKSKNGLLAMIFFWKSESIAQKNLNYQVKLNEYQQKLYDLDTSYLKQVVKMYSDALNRLNHIVIDQVEN